MKTVIDQNTGCLHYVLMRKGINPTLLKVQKLRETLIDPTNLTFNSDYFLLLDTNLQKGDIILTDNHLFSVWASTNIVGTTLISKKIVGGIHFLIMETDDLASDLTETDGYKHIRIRKLSDIEIEKPYKVLKWETITQFF